MNTFANDVRPTLSLAGERCEVVFHLGEPEEVSPANLPDKGVKQQMALAAVGRADHIFRELDALTVEVHAALFQARVRLLCVLLEEVQASLAENLA